MDLKRAFRTPDSTSLGGKPVPPRPERRCATPAWTVDAVGFWCVLGYAALALLAQQPGEPPLPAFFLLVAWTGLPVFGLFLHFRRREEPFPLGRLFFWAIAFRICGLAGGPFYEDDFYRYLWDGYRFATAGSPYGPAPEMFFLDPSVPPAMQSVLSGINYPELPTIYAPVTQVIFLLGYWVHPGSVAVLQAILILLDLALVVLLLRLAPARNVLLYAWCPLVVKEIAFTAHPDGAGACLLLAAVVLSRDRRWQVAAITLGLAAGAKAFGLLLAPLLLAGARLRHWLLAGATVAAVYAPFTLRGGSELASLQVFAREWEFNSWLFGLLKTALQPIEARLALGLAFLAIWGWYHVKYYRSSAREIPRGDWIFGGLLAVSPVINPWYLLWLLPFAAVYPTIWAWTASLAVLLSYVTGLNLQDYAMQPFGQPLWARGLEFGLILCGLGCDLVRRRWTGRDSQAGAKG
ncbi:MAG: hypothetical protein OXI92_12475 [Acidobacteriota bacterium]|nr:hypothetical protein [Acidobacteriota bacterium]